MRDKLVSARLRGGCGESADVVAGEPHP